jgi:hypothetical protein
MSRPKLRNFLDEVQREYGANPYHNHMHGADVLLGVHLFLRDYGYASALSPVERLAAIFAAALHDVAHPGTTNSHEVKAVVKGCSPLALRYNDSSRRRSRTTTALPPLRNCCIRRTTSLRT